MCDGIASADTKRLGANGIERDRAVAAFDPAIGSAEFGKMADRDQALLAFAMVAQPVVDGDDGFKFVKG